MRKQFCLTAILLFVLNLHCLAESPLEGFVLIKGDTFQQGTGEQQRGSEVRIDEFEILDHPLTNQEYKIFVDASKYPAPYHWIKGQIPEEKNEYPVIFVNRFDAEAYCRWLTKKTGRIHRLPTSPEFEYAARGGLAGKNYPWGNDGPEGKANFDVEQNRRFDRWQEYLLPSRNGDKNGFGLYGMAGNVWQLTTDYPEPEMERFKYRIEDPIDLERGIMGGSWARGMDYLKCGYRLSLQPGIRYPDTGFRVVREPAGEDWRIVPRKLCAVNVGEGKIFLSWALLESDRQSTCFFVYRATRRNHAGFRISEEPVHTTSFIDTGLKTGSRYQYYIRPVDLSGKEGPRSEWIGVPVNDVPSAVVTSFKPIFKQGNLVPIFGDLDGDAKLDCVIRMDNGNQEMSQDTGYPVQLEAFTSYGRSMWRKDICWHSHCYGSANNVPYNVWDMDHDGKAEVNTRLQIGQDVFVAILDGMSGQLKYKTPWPDMVSDFSKSSTRIHMSIAYLDGIHPAVITQTGLYENEVFAAYDNQLNPLWRFDSFAETNGSGGHKIEIADVDGDGKQEVFDGTTCLNHDGTLRWSIYRQHPDIVSIHDYLPNRPGLEVFYIVESSVHAGVYMVDANTGEVIWKVNREDDPRWTHGHTGWTADIWDGAPGIECVSNRAGHTDYNLVLFSAAGKHLLEPFPYGYTPLEWDGDATRELLKGREMGNFDGKTIIPASEDLPQFPLNSHPIMVADLYGDFRDEIVCMTAGANGEQYISVITAATLNQNRFLSKTEKLDYRLWLARNMGGGYRSIYDQPLMAPKE